MLWVVLIVAALLVVMSLWLRHNAREDEFTRGLRRQGLEYGAMAVFGLAVGAAAWGEISGVDAARPYAVGAVLAILGLNLGELLYAWWRLRR
ncbi:hypothetical protein Mterra_00385 [Calidithermus terrae]|uniref:Uncharacterized protein n=1 Tax=Calidithermus terrae TaxID=1408545 RepID=A0A399F5E6_9DEIN|nr:hypothetical protein [Calidithermus terrae]RIH90499.1 hypothetical protein Mterra_00385 [Calidithermus terrae]